jgi:hypothetical protein
MVRHISAALLSTTTVLGLITGISGVTVLTLVQGHTLWWMYVLGVLTFIVTLADALRRATSTTNTAETRPQVSAVGGAGGSADHGGHGGAGGSNYIGQVG